VAGGCGGSETVHSTVARRKSNVATLYTPTRNCYKDPQVKKHERREDDGRTTRVVKRLRRALHCLGISHASDTPISVLQSLLARNSDSFSSNRPPNLRCDRLFRSKDSSTTLTDVANAWPQRIPHAYKARIISVISILYITSSNTTTPLLHVPGCAAYRPYAFFRRAN